MSVIPWNASLLIALVALLPAASADSLGLVKMAASADGTNQVLTVELGHAVDTEKVMTWNLVVAGVPVEIPGQDGLAAKQNSFQSAVRMLENGRDIWYYDLVEYRDDWVTDAACYYNSRAGIHEGYVVIVGLLLKTTDCWWHVSSGCAGACPIPLTATVDCTLAPKWRVDLPLVTLKNTVVKRMDAECIVQSL